jgi:PIN domain nuclease of toxin-antitoxin system
MKVVADSHVIYWYLFNPGKLSELALSALGDAENSQGIAISAITLPELWMSHTRKKENAVSRDGYEILRRAVFDENTAVDVEPISPEVLRYFEEVSLSIADPMDCFVVSTALAAKAPLVTADRRVRDSTLVEVIW